MSRLTLIQIICITVTVISMLVMGTHLFVGDRVSHPQPVLTVIAVLALAGLIGNAVCTYLRSEQKARGQHDRDDH